MNPHTLSHLSDETLLQALSSLVAQDRSTTAVLLTHIAEVDLRKLYAPAGYPSMFAYCVEELRLSEDAASRRIRVARLARQHPEIFTVIADGRLHLSAVIQLGSFLTPENAADLIGAACGKTKQEIDGLLARRFPLTESNPLVETVHDPSTSSLPAPAPVENLPAPRPARVSAPSNRMVETAAKRFTVHVTIHQETKDLLDRAEELLGPARESRRILAVLPPR